MRTIDIPPGTSIEDACEMAVKAVESTRDRDPIGFEFNGVRVEVHEGMTVDEVMELAHNGKIAKGRYEAAKFEQDLRAAIRGSIPPNPSPITMEQEISRIIAAIRPFLRTP